MDWDSLFQTEVRRQGTVPIPLTLLDLWKPALVGGPTNPSVAERQIPTGTGGVYTVRVVGDPAFGLPTVDDFDLLFVLLGLAVERGTCDLSGQVSLNDLLRRAGRPVKGSEKAAARLGIKRWGSTHLYAEQGWVRRAAPTAVPPAPLPVSGRHGVRRPTTADGSYSILGLFRVSEFVAGDRVTGPQTFIDRLVFEPWIVDAARTAPFRWIDLVATASLTPFQKRLVHRLLWRSVAAPAADALTGWTQTQAEWVAECGGSKDHSRLLPKAIAALSARGLVVAEADKARGGASPAVRLRLGEVAATWVAASRVAPNLPVEHARLVATLTRAPFSLSVSAAQELIARDASRTLEAVQRVLYGIVGGGTGKAIDKPGLWVKSAVTVGFDYGAETGFQAWRAAMVAQGGLRLGLAGSTGAPGTAVVVASGAGVAPSGSPAVVPPSAAPAPLPLPRDPFEMALDALVRQHHAMTLATTLGQLTPVGVPQDGELTLEGDPVAVERVRAHAAMPALLTLVSESYGAPVRSLRVVRPGASLQIPATTH